MNTTIQDILREIRKEFFAFRNGIIADKLRKAGDPHSIIMGCLLVDVIAIAQRTRESIGDEEKLAAIALELWGDTSSRECRLAAPMLYPIRLMTNDMAMKIVQPIAIESHQIANPTSNYSIYLLGTMIPGVLGLIVLMTTIFSIGKRKNTER